MREAMHYHKEGEAYRCDLCPRNCLIQRGKTGFCRGRTSGEDKLYATNYGKAVSIAIDPIEKKPLYLYHPNSMIVSLGPNSCNLSCSFCQNWQISQQECPTEDISIAALADIVGRYHPKQVAFTYSEPLMWYEYIWDFAVAYPDVDIVLVTNAYLCVKSWEDILPKIKAVNIDLKSINNEFYRSICGGDVHPVLDNIVVASKQGVHIETTNLLIPGLNNAPEEVESLARHIASIDNSIPLHISAYRPCYRMQVRSTTTGEIKAACEIAAKYLKHVYAGNVFVPEYSREKT